MYKILVTITLLVIRMYLCLYEMEVMTDIKCTLCSWYHNFPFILYLFLRNISLLILSTQRIMVHILGLI